MAQIQFGEEAEMDQDEFWVQEGTTQLRKCFGLGNELKPTHGKV